MTKKKKILIGATLGVLVLTVILTITLISNKQPTSTANTSKAQTENSNVIIATPDVNNDASAVVSQTEQPKTLNVNVSGKQPDTDSDTSSKTPAKPGAIQVKQVTPTESPDKNDDGGINIGGGAVNANDHPETDAFIANLKLQGCPYCGQHDCPSFNAVDKWGNPCYNPKLCPKYDIHKDPVYYCQDCGKPIGDGTNGTCCPKVDGSGCGCTDGSCNGHCTNKK